MGRAVIPVDLLNPGQVFACLGFLEAAEILCGPAAGGFDWEKGECFILDVDGNANPVEEVLEFLSATAVKRLAPAGWIDPSKKKANNKAGNRLRLPEDVDAFEIADSFPARVADKMTLPIRIGGGNRPIIELGHWTDGSSRNSFKLYAGNRTATKIAVDMLGMIRKLWDSQRERLLHEPLNTLCPMSGSFNFDPRGAWTAIDAGYSPNEHKAIAKGGNVFASPVVEFLATWGMEHARADEYEVRQVRYAIWRGLLPPVLARPALSGVVSTLCSRRFLFSLDKSGENRVICFAQEEWPHD